MLKNSGQNHDVLAVSSGDQGTGGAHSEVGPAGDDVVDGVYVRAALKNLDL